MYGKIIDGKIIIAGEKIQIPNGWATKPTEEELKKYGYKNLCYNPKPEYDNEEEKLVEKYTEEEARIVISYEVVALTDKEHNAIIQAEIVAEENKITPRRQREIDLKQEGALEFAETVENNIVELRKKFR